MNAEHGKVYPVVYVQGVKRPGDIYLGASPKPGNLLDSEGRLILVHRYGPAPQNGQTIAAPAAPEPKGIITRGIRAGAPQRTLL